MKKGRKLIVFILVLAMLVSNFSFVEPVEAAEVDEEKIDIDLFTDGNAKFSVSDLAGCETVRIYAQAKEAVLEGTVIGWLGWGSTENDECWAKKEKYSIFGTNSTGDVVFEFSASDLIEDVDGAFDDIYINLWYTNQNTKEKIFNVKSVAVVKGEVGTELFVNNTDQHNNQAFSKTDIEGFERIEVTAKAVGNGTPSATGTIGCLCIGTKENNYNNFGLNDGSSLLLNVDKKGNATVTTVFQVSDILAAMTTYGGDAVFVNVYDENNKKEDYVLYTVVGYGKSNSSDSGTTTPDEPTELWGAVGNGRIRLSKIGPYEKIVVTVDTTGKNFSNNQVIGGLCLQPNQDSWTVTEGFEAIASGNGDIREFTFYVDDIFEVARDLNNDYAIRINIYSDPETGENNGLITSVKGYGTRDYNAPEIEGYEKLETEILPIRDGGYPVDYWFDKAHLEMYSQIQVVLRPADLNTNRQEGKEIGGICFDDEGTTAHADFKFYSNDSYPYESRIFDVDEILEAMENRVDANGRPLAATDRCLVNAYDELYENDGTPATPYIIHEIRGTLKPLEPDKIYVQTTPVEGKTETDLGTYDIRFVQLIKREDIKKYSWVEYQFTRSDNNKKATLSGKKDSKYNRVYDEVQAVGQTLYAPTGYLYLAIAVCNVPENIRLTCEITKGNN